MVVEDLQVFLLEQKQLKIKKVRAKFRAKLRFADMDDKTFEKCWKEVSKEVD